MPYISTKQVAEIRAQLKKEFPSVKFSVTRERPSSIHITVLEGPVVFPVRTAVNHFYIADHYQDQPEQRDFLLKIKEIANKGNYTESEDGDYGSIPSFYLNIRVGDYDRDYKQVNTLQPGPEDPNAAYEKFCKENFARISLKSLPDEA